MKPAFVAIFCAVALGPASPAYSEPDAKVLLDTYKKASASLRKDIEEKVVAV